MNVEIVTKMFLAHQVQNVNNIWVKFWSVGQLIGQLLEQSLINTISYVSKMRRNHNKIHFTRVMYLFMVAEKAGQKHCLKL